MKVIKKTETNGDKIFFFELINCFLQIELKKVTQKIQIARMRKNALAPAGSISCKNNLNSSIINQTRGVTKKKKAMITEIIHLYTRSCENLLSGKSFEIFPSSFNC